MLYDQMVSELKLADAPEAEHVLDADAGEMLGLLEGVFEAGVPLGGPSKGGRVKKVATLPCA